MAQTVMYLYTESPLHAGSGTGLGTIDLPIQRERHTDFPVVQGSGIKGALRALAQAKTPTGDDPASTAHAAAYLQVVRAVFGPDTTHAADHAGAITVGDARLLLFPVRSLRGVFAWATTPLILQRLQRDVELITGARPPWTVPDDLDTPAEAEQILIPHHSGVRLPDGHVVLEEYTFAVQPDTDQPNAADAFAAWLAPQLGGLDPWWTQRISSHLVILPGSAFRDFVLYSTEVVTRVRLNQQTKTVERGALWTEESLPTDSLLYSPIMARTPTANGIHMKDAEALAFVQGVAQGVCQLGGDETVGRGLVRPIWLDQEGTR